MRKCRECSKYLDPGMFRLGSNKKPVRICRECENSQNLKRYHGNPGTRDAHREASRRYVLKQYGLTVDDFNMMRQAADYSCEICKTHESQTRFGTLCVDHHHSSGVVRGLLCNSCNTALGYLKEDKELFLKSVAYLERHANIVETTDIRSGD